MNAPTVRPMTPQTRQRIRRQILDEASRRPRRRSHGWVPAVAAIAGVIAVAVPAGQLMQAGGGNDSGPAATSAPLSPTARPDPRAYAIDRGAPSAAQLTEAKNWCLQNQNAADGSVVFARRVLWRPAPITPQTVTAVVIRTADGKHLGCLKGMWDDAVSSLPVPTETDPVKRLEFGGPTSSGMAEFYRVHPSVARLEARVTFPARGWSRAVISNGIAYALGDVDLDHPQGLELRAFDTAGRPIPIPGG